MKRNNILIALAIYIGLSSGTSFCAQPSRFSWVTQGVSSAWQTVTSPFNSLMEKMQGWSTRQLLTIVGTGLTLLITYGIISRNTKVGTLVSKTKILTEDEKKAQELDKIIATLDTYIKNKNINDEHDRLQIATLIAQYVVQFRDNDDISAVENFKNRITNLVGETQNGEQKKRYQILQKMVNGAIGLLNAVAFPSATTQAEITEEILKYYEGYQPK
jgi:hypothetical protein